MVNQVQLVGRLGKDPEVRFTQAGTAVCTFPLATEEAWVKDGERQKRTEWHTVECWDKIGEACGKYLAKGSLVFVSGMIRTDSWEKDGQKHWRTKVRADAVKFLDQRGAGEQRANPAPDADQDDDIPF